MKNKHTFILFALLLALVCPIALTSADMNMPSSVKPKPSQTDPNLTKAKTAVYTLNSTQKTKLLTLLNKGSDKELNAIKGIAASRSKRIIEARPFNQIEDLVKVKGIGLSIFSQVLDHSKQAGMPEV